MMDEYKESQKRVRVLRPRQLSQETMDRVCARAYEDVQKAEAETKRIMEYREYILKGFI